MPLQNNWTLMNAIENTRNLIFDRLSFQLQSEKTNGTLTKLNTDHTGVFTYQPDKFDWITRTQKIKNKLL